MKNKPIIKKIIFSIICLLVFLSNNNGQTTNYKNNNLCYAKNYYEPFSNIDFNKSNDKITSPYLCKQEIVYIDTLNNFKLLKKNRHKLKLEDIIPDYSPFTENHYSSPKPHKRHAWRIKSGDKLKKKYTREFAKFETKNLQDLFLTIRNNKAEIYLPDLKSCSRYFKYRKDGLCLEFISFKDYKSDSIYYTKPARRNGACIFNGMVKKPLYKKDIKKLIKKQKKIKGKTSLLINFGNIPAKFLNDIYQINLIILKKNRIADIVHFVTVTGDYFYYPIFTKTLPYSFNINDVVNPYKPQYDTLIHKIYFKRNSCIIDTGSVNYIKTRLNKKGYKPLFAKITSFASVEGTEERNKILFKKRADNLKKIINEEIADSIPIKTFSKENWNLFNRQVSHTKYKFLRNSTKKSIKKFLLLDKNLTYFDKQLKKQRYVNLYYVSKEIVTEEKEIKYALDNYISLFNKINKEKLNSLSREKTKLSDIQHYIFKKITEGKIGMDALDTLPTMFIINKYKNQKKAFWKLERDKLNFELANDTALTTNDKYIRLKKLIRIKGVDMSKIINYYIMNVSSEYRNKLKSPEPINKKFLKKYKRNLTKAERENKIHDINKLRLFYHIKKLTIEYKKNPYSQFTSSMSSIKYICKYFSNTKINENDRYKAALFLSLLHKNEYAFKILKSICLNGTKNKSIIRNFIILFFRSDNSLTDKLQLLSDFSPFLTQEEWCGLFTDKRNRIDFQIMDNRYIRDYYFDRCGCKK